MGRLNFKSRFLLKNLFKGLIALAVIVIVYIFLQKHTPFDTFINDYLGQWPMMVYTVFVISEVVFGIIPPELFMIWSIHNGAFETYALDVALLAGISYAAGVLGYFIGSKLHTVSFFRNLFKKYLKKYQNTLNRYGGFLIFVGAVTPVPFSAICMLSGASNYSFSRFLLVALFRFVRFGVYAYVIYQANI